MASEPHWKGRLRTQVQLLQATVCSHEAFQDEDFALHLTAGHMRCTCFQPDHLHAHSSCHDKPLQQLTDRIGEHLFSILALSSGSGKGGIFEGSIFGVLDDRTAHFDVLFE